MRCRGVLESVRVVEISQSSSVGSHRAEDESSNTAVTLTVLRDIRNVFTMSAAPVPQSRSTVFFFKY